MSLTAKSWQRVVTLALGLLAVAVVSDAMGQFKIIGPATLGFGSNGAELRVAGVSSTCTGGATQCCSGGRFSQCLPTYGLRLEVWALDRPYSLETTSLAGPNVFKVASMDLPPLQTYHRFSNVDSGLIDYVLPPNGTYFNTLLLVQTNLGSGATMVLDALPFDQPWTAPATAVEYYHHGFGHYFITTLPEEIDKLDRGVLPGWERTGASFLAESLDAPGTRPVCRFYSTSFGAKGSHFFTAVEDECNVVKQSPDWVFEGPVFGVQLPSAAGECPSGTRALYRLYNNGMGGAPNHRFTVSTVLRELTLGNGWVSEGYGHLGVTACVPK